MKKSIHRFLINLSGTKAPFEGTVMMPAGAVILSAGLSSKGLNIFAIVPLALPLPEPALESEPRLFRIFRTGEEFTNEQLGGMKHVETIALPGQPAFHVFEVTA